MAANPLTYTELEAYERKALVKFTAFETDLLMRVDDAVMAAWAGDRPKPNTKEPAAIPASDTSAVRAIFRGLATQKRLEREAKKPGP